MLASTWADEVEAEELESAAAAAAAPNEAEQKATSVGKDVYISQIAEVCESIDTKPTAKPLEVVRLQKHDAYAQPAGSRVPGVSSALASPALQDAKASQLAQTATIASLETKATVNAGDDSAADVVSGSAATESLVKAANESETVSLTNDEDRAASAAAGLTQQELDRLTASVQAGASAVASHYCTEVARILGAWLEGVTERMGVAIASSISSQLGAIAPTAAQQLPPNFSTEILDAVQDSLVPVTDALQQLRDSLDRIPPLTSASLGSAPQLPPPAMPPMPHRNTGANSASYHYATSPSHHYPNQRERSGHGRSPVAPGPSPTQATRKQGGQQQQQQAGRRGGNAAAAVAAVSPGSVHSRLGSSRNREDTLSAAAGGQATERSPSHASPMEAASVGGSGQQEDGAAGGADAAARRKVRSGWGAYTPPARRDGRADDQEDEDYAAAGGLGSEDTPPADYLGTTSASRPAGRGERIQRLYQQQHGAASYNLHDDRDAVGAGPGNAPRRGGDDRDSYGGGGGGGGWRGGYEQDSYGGSGGRRGADERDSYGAGGSGSGRRGGGGRGPRDNPSDAGREDVYSQGYRVSMDHREAFTPGPGPRRHFLDR